MDFSEAVADIEETVQTSHPLHAALVGAGTWALTGDPRVGALVGSATLAYMLVWGHSLPSFLSSSSSSQGKQDPAPAVIIPHDWRCDAQKMCSM